MSTRQKANAARDHVIDRLRQEGLHAAYERGIKLLRDDAVPATAHANMVRVMFAAGGLLNAPENDGPDKEPHEMTGDELAAAIEYGQTWLAERQAARDAEDEDEEDDTVFG